MALSVAGDSPEAKAAALQLIDDLGFDPIDGGNLDNSWRQQAGMPAYCQDLEAAALRRALTDADRSRIAEYRAEEEARIRTYYVLNPAKGFEVARKGKNEFHAFVARTGDDTFKGSWPLTEYRDDILYPIAFDKADTKAQMRVFFDAAEMQAKGTPSGELKKIIQDRYKAGFYKAPERAGVSLGGTLPDYVWRYDARINGRKNG